MRHLVALITVGAAVVVTPTLAVEPETPPPWAYAVNPPSAKPAPDDGIRLRVPGSAMSFTLT